MVLISLHWQMDENKSIPGKPKTLETICQMTAFPGFPSSLCYWKGLCNTHPYVLMEYLPMPLVCFKDFTFLYYINPSRNKKFIKILMYSHCSKKTPPTQTPEVCIYVKIFILINIISVMWNRVLIKQWGAFHRTWQFKNLFWGKNTGIAENVRKKPAN